MVSVSYNNIIFGDQFISTIMISFIIIRNTYDILCLGVEWGEIIVLMMMMMMTMMMMMKIIGLTKTMPSSICINYDNIMFSDQFKNHHNFFLCDFFFFNFCMKIDCQD